MSLIKIITSILIILILYTIVYDIIYKIRLRKFKKNILDNIFIYNTIDKDTLEVTDTKIVFKLKSFNNLKMKVITLHKKDSLIIIDNKIFKVIEIYYYINNKDDARKAYKKFRGNTDKFEYYYIVLSKMLELYNN